MVMKGIKAEVTGRPQSNYYLVNRRERRVKLLSYMELNLYQGVCIIAVYNAFVKLNEFCNGHKIGSDI